MASAVAHLVNFIVEIWVQLPTYFTSDNVFYLYQTSFLYFYLYKILKIVFSPKIYVNFHAILFV